MSIGQPLAAMAADRQGVRTGSDRRSLPPARTASLTPNVEAGSASSGRWGRRKWRPASGPSSVWGRQLLHLGGC
jgi:hypothetical protein